MPTTTADTMSTQHPGEGRLVTDPATRSRWFVHEVDAARVAGARGRRCLVFHALGVARRVWDYPPDWVDLPDETLMALGGPDAPAWRPWASVAVPDAPVGRPSRGE